jgi:hypothetical protein
MYRVEGHHPVPNDRARRDLQSRRRHFFNKRVSMVNYIASEAKAEEMLVDGSATVVDDHVRFPDLRLEYEWPDGRRDFQDLEITTPHYRDAHAQGKSRAGFTCCGAVGPRVGARSGRRGGRPVDPGVAEELV